VYVEQSATARCISGPPLLFTEAQLGSILRIKSCPRLFEQEWCDSLQMFRISSFLENVRRTFSHSN